MNRYDIDDCGDEILDPDGGWVKYQDHTAEIARLRAELDKCFCKSCYGTGRIDSDGFCENCELGRVKAELDAAKAIIETQRKKISDLGWAVSPEVMGQ